MYWMVFLSLLFAISSVSARAQGAIADFSGTWKLDTTKSKLDERARIESMTMNVSQTATEITVSTETKRAAPPEGAPGGRGPGMGRGGLGDGKFTYSLDGKETTSEQASQFGVVPVKLKASGSGSTLKLTLKRTVNSPMGEMTMTTNEEWTLSADGKSLTVKRDQETPRGTNSSTFVFVKG